MTEIILCRYCQQPIERAGHIRAWLHTDGFLYCASKPLSTRAAPPQDYQSPVQHLRTYTCGGCSLAYTTSLVGPESAVCPRCNPRRTTNQPVQHLDADRMRGPSDWDRECQESRRLNR